MILDYRQGKDGITPHIGDNGNWFIGTTDTGVAAQGTVESGGSATILVNGILKGDGTGNVVAATAGTDYVVPSNFGEGTLGFYPEIVVNTATGTNVVCTNGTSTFSGTSVDNQCRITVNAYGVWEVYGIFDDYQCESIFITVDSIKQYSCCISVNQEIFGVCWDYSNSSTQLTRLTADTDPNGWVNTCVSEEPVAALSTGQGSSPFDIYMPWSGMEEYNIVNGEVVYKKGGADFSRTSYDTFVYIPEFYYRVIDDVENNKRYWYVSNKPADSFEKHPGSNKYVGKYEAGSGVTSLSGVAPHVYITRPDARTTAITKGDGYGLLDYSTLCAIYLLYIVEFADWDSQTVVGQGLTSSKSNAYTGATDTMTYHTGTVGTSRTTTASVLYRNLENMWGNIWAWVDGIISQDYNVYIATDGVAYSDDVTDYTATSIAFAAGSGITHFAYIEDAPWIFVPSAVDGSTSTYIPDATWAASGTRVIACGGSRLDGSNAGLFAFCGDRTAGEDLIAFGYRLMFRPDTTTTEE